MSARKRTEKVTSTMQYEAAKAVSRSDALPHLPEALRRPLVTAAADALADAPAKAARALVAKRRAEREDHRTRAAEIWTKEPTAFTTDVARMIERECQKAGKKCKAKTIQEHIRDLRLRQSAD